ncbi:MAG TPA: hypothetical protein VH637_05985 [Streptosporangiaceae bacterium]|jgi:hypothetical protein
MRALSSAPGYLRGAFLIAGCAGALLALADADSIFRGPAVLLFLIAAPALAVASLLRRLDTAARFVVAITAAITLNVLVAEVMLAAGGWSPRAGLTAIAIISAVIAVIGLWGHRRWPQPQPGWAGRSAAARSEITGRG